MTQIQHNIAVIGRAFSGTALGEDLHLQFEKQGISGQSVTYFGPEDVGPAYRASNDALILNRPTKVMNAFEGEWADYNAHLERQHAGGKVAVAYNNSSFPPRSTFGSLILETNKSHDARYEVIGNSISRVEQFVSSVRKEADGTYTLILQDGISRSGFTKVVNATGHEIVRDDELDNHANVISPYADANWEDKVGLVKRSITQNGGEIVLVGGGGTTLDAGVLVAYDSSAALRIFSEYGDVSHHFHADVSPSAAVTQAVRAKLDGFFNGFGDDRYNKAIVGDKIRQLLAAYETENPRQSLGSGNYSYPDGYVYPQFVFAELLADKRIRLPENETILKGVIAFNGNPVAPERQKLWEKLQAEGRVIIENKRVTVKPNGPNSTWLHVEGEEQPRKFDGIVIRGDKIRRGYVEENGVPVNPVLRSQHKQGLIAVSTTDARVYPIFSAQDPNIINIGATTYGDANSVKVFRVGTEAAAIQIAAEVKGSITPQNLLKLLDQRRKDGGLPIRILDVREAHEHDDATLNQHGSVDVRKLPFNSVIKQDGFSAENVTPILPNDNIPTIVICAGGIRSDKAIQTLRAFGYNNLVNAEGGFSGLVAQIKNTTQLDYLSGAGIEKNRPLIASGGSAAVDPCGGGSSAFRPAAQSAVLEGQQYRIA